MRAGKPEAAIGVDGSGLNSGTAKWVWRKIEQEGLTQVLVHVSTYQGNPFWHRIFEPQANDRGIRKPSGQPLSTCYNHSRQ